MKSAQSLLAIGRNGAPALLSLSACVLLAGMAGGAFDRSESDIESQLLRQGRGWSRAAVVDADSPRARRYQDEDQLPVRLPDASGASVAVRHGRARALMLPPSNEIADERERALQAGAQLDPGQNIVLATTTRSGDRIDFLFARDGGTFASAAAPTQQP